ncbi:hypothetical protein TUM3794_05290 [Shewanella colwelliana]|uniref:Ankryin n=1 Tax=Shewanella colwelliana TaxID=23 RepID=A0ABQ4NV76_SHECO|nr:ankyrin repeat domain-containing protein [Shewanella colwelliana]GIU36317.1 hypothetical protein TUM3794_05290 [Shewanella colwelliana]
MYKLYLSALITVIFSLSAIGAELIDAISENNEALAIKLIEKTQDLNAKGKYGSTALYLASMRGQKKVVKKLLTLNVNLEILADNGENALHPAADKERIEIAEMLLKAGINPNQKNKYGDTPLNYFGKNSQHPMALLLIKYGAERN